MRVDLFDLIEGLFRGVVYFVYNIFETTFTILRHPIRGPIQLHRWHLQPKRQQMSSLTFLLVSFTVFYWILLSKIFAPEDESEVTTDFIIERLTSASVNTSNLDISSLWPMFVLGLVSTIIIDAVLRLILRGLLPRSKAWRDAILASTEYAFFWMILFFGLFYFSAERLISWNEGVVKWALYLALPLSALPAATIISIGLRPQRRRKGLTILMQLIWLPLLIALFGGSLAGGFVLNSEHRELRKSQQRTAESELVTTLRCAVRRGGMIEVYGVVHHDGDGIALMTSELVFEIDAPENPDPKFSTKGLLNVGTQPNRVIVATKNQPQAVHLRLTRPVELPDDPHCRLRTDSFFAEGNWVRLLR